jgi:hypothetical protein
MLGQRSCIISLLCILEIIVSIKAAPRSKGEPNLIRAQSVRRLEHSTKHNEVQAYQNHRRVLVPKGKLQSRFTSNTTYLVTHFLCRFYTVPLID